MQCNTDSCCEHITGGVNVNLYGCDNLLAQFISVFVYVTSNQSTREKPRVSELSKPDAFLHKAHNKFLLVLTYCDSKCVHP